MVIIFFGLIFLTTAIFRAAGEICIVLWPQSDNVDNRLCTLESFCVM